MKSKKMRKKSQKSKERYGDVKSMAGKTYNCSNCEENCDIENNIFKGETFDSSGVSQNHIDVPVCNDCIENDYMACIDCGVYSHNDDEGLNRSSVDNELRCNECYDEAFVDCESCGSTLWSEDARYDDDYPYCDECYEESDNREEGRWDCDFEFINSKTFNENKSKRMVGIEIEAKFGNSVDTYKKCRDFVSCKYDGSIDEGDEFCSNPMNGDILFDNIKLLCKSIRKDNYSIDKDCGLHIHIDMRDFSENDLRKLYLVYHRFERYFLEMVPSSRRDNGYCKSLRPNYEKIIEMPIKNYLYRAHPKYNMESFIPSTHDGNRYYWLNMNSAISKRNSLEIRLHGGTIDSEKIIKWIRIHLNLIEWIKKTDIKRIISMKNRLRTLLSIINEKDLQRYILARRRKFNKKLRRVKITNIKERLDGLKNDYTNLFDVPRPEYFDIILAIKSNGLNEIQCHDTERDVFERSMRRFIKCFGRDYQDSGQDILWLDFKRYHNYLRSCYLENNIDIGYLNPTREFLRRFCKNEWRRFNKNVRNTICESIE